MTAAGVARSAAKRYRRLREWHHGGCYAISAVTAALIVRGGRRQGQDRKVY